MGLAARWMLALALQAGAQEDATHVVEKLVEELPGGGRVECEVRAGAGGARVRHGTYERWHPNGVLAARGEYRDGDKVGWWETFYENGQQATDEHWRRGLRDGEQKSWHPDGRFADKEVYEAEFELYPDGTPRWEGENLKLGGTRRHGVWRWFWPDGGLRLEGHYHRTTPDGRWTWYWHDGTTKRFEGEFERVREGGEWHSRRAGEWTFWHPNGCPDPGFLSGRYEDGARVEPEEDAAEPRPDERLLTAPLPAPPAHPEGGPRDVRGIAAAIADWLAATDAASTALLDGLEARGLRVVPAALIGWTALDLSDPGDAEKARRIASLLPRGVDLGAWRDGTGGDALRDNRLLRLRWCSVWEHLCSTPDALEALAGAPRSAFLEPFFGAEPDGPEPDLAACARTGEAAAEHVRWLLAPGRDGGGEEARAALDSALAWLAAAQERDGSWSGSVGATGLALLALVEGGSTVDRGVHALGVNDACGWLIAKQSHRTGWIGEGTPARDHAIATLALASALRGADRPTMRRFAQFALDCVREPGRPVPGDDEASGWVLVALARARDALDLDVAERDLAWGLEWAAASGGDIGIEALRLWCRLRLGQSPVDEPAIGESARRLLDAAPEWSDEAPAMEARLYATRALYELGGAEWQAWNEMLEDRLLAAQREDGELAGSWDPGPGSDRATSTALGALCLTSGFR